MKFFLYFLTIAFGIVCFVIMKKKRFDQLPPRGLRKGIEHRIFVTVGLGLLAVYALPVNRLGVREGDIIQVRQFPGLGHQHRGVVVHHADQLVARNLPRGHLLGGRDVDRHGIDDILADRSHALVRSGGKSLPYLRDGEMRRIGLPDPVGLALAARLDDLVLLGKSPGRDTACRQQQRESK